MDPSPDYQPRHARPRRYQGRHIRRGAHLRPSLAAVGLSLLAILIYLAGEQRAGQPWPASPAQAAPSGDGAVPSSSSGPVAGGAEPPESGRGGAVAASSATGSTPALGPASPTNAQRPDGAAVTRQQAQEGRSPTLAPPTTPGTSQGPSAVPSTTVVVPPTTVVPDPTTTLPPVTTRPPATPGQDGGRRGPAHTPGCDPRPEQGQDGEHGHPECEEPAG